MEIVWDEPKRLANIDKHGLDFADLTLDFFLNARVRPAHRGRYQAIGRLADGTISVVFVTLGIGGNFGGLDAPGKSDGKEVVAMTAKAKRRKTFKGGRGYTKGDWVDVSDNPEWTKKSLKKAKPFSEAFPDLVENIKRARGRPRVEAPKEAVTLRLDPSTLAKFQATGKNWRTNMVKVLDKAKV